MLQIHPPTKKAKYYFSKVTMDGAQVVIKIPFASLTQMMSLVKQDGYLTMIDVSQDQNALAIIKNIEDQCITSLINNNRKWFRNGLDETVIHNMFDSTLLHENVRAYVSFLRSHLEVPGYNDFLEWYNKAKLPAPYHITLICDGLFIYPERFGLRWIIRSIKEHKEDPDDIVPEYAEIISYWEEKVEARKKILDALMLELKTQFSDKAVGELKKYII